MFKLIKIKGARTNVPEIEVINIDGVTAYKAGALYYISDGILSKSWSCTYDIKFIPIETVPANSGKTTIRGYTVTSEMVFEAKVYSMRENIPVGQLMCFNYDTDGNITGLDDMEGDDALILSKEGAEITHKYLVALAW